LRALSPKEAGLFCMRIKWVRVKMETVKLEMVTENQTLILIIMKMMKKKEEEEELKKAQVGPRNQITLKMKMTLKVQM
jgi:hypothetical protein